MVRTLGIIGLVFASLVAGCGNGSLTDPGGGPTKPLPQVSFITTDLSTGTRVATVQIYGGLDDVPADLVSAVASKVRVATWPGDGAVPTTEVITSVPYAILPNGAIQPASAEIEKQLDPALDASAWYAISLPPGATEYGTSANPFAFAFSGGARGARFSPAHAPVVASVMSCPKEAGVVAVYVRYSEPVVRATSAPQTFDYGVPPAGCAVGSDSAVETQFICANGGAAGQPFWLQIPQGVTAQASGAPMVPGTLDSTGMQTDVTNDGCTVHKPLTVD
jgi:hypothetical protein